MHVPNAFTPDGDGINDGFVPIFNLPWVDKYEFLIFDRWGERLFTSTTPGEVWGRQLPRRGCGERGLCVGVEVPRYAVKRFREGQRTCDRAEIVHFSLKSRKPRRLGHSH
ncbi:MAG: gliding motility-associated C-terminal domain-containing protein [Flavobacteriales bacterium]|nr:gliding motility-associated C-terminal domain-containing protein [Flavobacteriales bacterium]